MKRRIILALGLALALCLVFTTVAFATQATKQSTITYRSISIEVNGKVIAPVDVNGASTEPFILNSDGSTYLPVRAIGDALDLEVGWDNATSTVILTSGGTEKFADKVPADSPEGNKIQRIWQFLCACPLYLVSLLTAPAYYADAFILYCPVYSYKG